MTESRLHHTGVYTTPEMRKHLNGLREVQHLLLKCREDGALDEALAIELQYAETVSEMADELGSLLPRISGEWGLTSKGEFVYVEDTCTQ